MTIKLTDATAIRLINTAERTFGQLYVESATPATLADLAAASQFVTKVAQGTSYYGYSAPGRPNSTWTIIVVG